MKIYISSLVRVAILDLLWNMKDLAQIQNREVVGGNRTGATAVSQYRPDLRSSWDNGPLEASYPTALEGYEVGLLKWHYKCVKYMEHH